LDLRKKNNLLNVLVEEKMEIKKMNEDSDLPEEFLNFEFLQKAENLVNSGEIN
jgi:hypothetical protein